MSVATIIFARDDFSIPGAVEPTASGAVASPDAETHFFTLLRDGNPDVIVLDFTRQPSVGVRTIRKIRQRSQIPILVVCDVSHPSTAEFRIAGAADCIPGPIDIIVLNSALQRIIRVTGRNRTSEENISRMFRFAGFRFYPNRDLLGTANGASLGLTSSESRVLLHFVSHPWRLCPRAEIADVLYGGERRAGDRAIDIVINRLRRKLGILRGQAAEALVKTEYRRGYLLVADVSTAAADEDADAAA
jgi:two-component system, OmpR family, response regulator